MRTRYIERNDVESVAQVHLDSWNVAYRGLVPDSFIEGFTIEKRKEFATQGLDDERQDTIVVEDDSSVLGFVVFGVSRDDDAEQGVIGEIWGMYVDPIQWLEGAGTQLIQHALHDLRDKGYTVATLWTLEVNLAARSFYEKFGFSLDGAIKEVTLGESLPTVRYRKRL